MAGSTARPDPLANVASVVPSIAISSAQLGDPAAQRRLPQPRCPATWPGAGRRLSDGTTLDAGIIIWATGYRSDYSWIGIPGVIRDGTAVHRRGATQVPGLSFLGLSWQHTRGSALLGFVHDDAAHLAGRIASSDLATGAVAQPAAQRTA